MATAALVVACAAELLATAVSEWLPLESAIVFRDKLNGALVTTAPILLPSTRNCTLVVLEETLVETLMVPEMIAPEAGDVIDTVGGAEVPELLLFAPVEPLHPVQNSARTTNRLSRDTALLCSFDLPVGLGHDLIKVFPL